MICILIIKIDSASGLLRVSFWAVMLRLGLGLNGTWNSGDEQARRFLFSVFIFHFRGYSVPFSDMRCERRGGMKFRCADITMLGLLMIYSGFFLGTTLGFRDEIRQLKD